MAEAASKVPDFFWAQDGNHLFIKIGIVSPENIKAKVTDSTFTFTALKDKQKYELKFNFRFPIVANNTRHKITRFAEYVIEKVDSDDEPLEDIDSVVAQYLNI